MIMMNFDHSLRADSHHDFCQAYDSRLDSMFARKDLVPRTPESWETQPSSKFPSGVNLPTTTASFKFPTFQWTILKYRSSRGCKVLVFQVVSTSPPPLLSTSPPIHHHSTAGRVSQAVEKSEEDDLKMAAFPKDLDGQTCPGQLSKLLVHGQRFQLEIEQRMRSVGLPIISSNPDQT